NAHVILEKADNQKKSTIMDKRDPLICLSAKTPSALDKLSDNLSAFISKNDKLDINCLAYTLQTGRDHFQFRRTVVEGDVNKLIRELSAKNKTKVINESPQ